MKKILCLIVSCLCLTLGACKKNDNVIKVGASSVPHGEILEEAKALLKAKGYDLEIIIFDDYVQPNIALKEKTIDANYFQHLPYLESFNKNNKADLVSVAKIHYEPLGLYGKNITSLEEANKTILIPNDDSNGTRALILLAEAGLITIKKGKNVDTGVTIFDIENKNGFTITELNAEIIPATLLNSNKGTLAVINGNYALSANININTALAKENSESEASVKYGNIIATRKENEANDKIKALVEVLTSEAIKNFIENKYKGAVVPFEK